MLKVYYADISALEITENMINCFSNTRLEKLQKAKNYHTSASVEALLCYALGRKPCYAYKENGKPYFTDCDLYFNISHSGDYVACALSDHPVGMDIQKETEYKDRVARRVFSETEYELLQKSENKQKTFCCIWAKKEAAVKLTGGGIGQLLGGETFTKAVSMELDGYSLAVCGRGEAEFIEVLAQTLTDFFEGMK